MEVAGPLGTPLGLAQRKRASPRGEQKSMKLPRQTPRGREGDTHTHTHTHTHTSVVFGNSSVRSCWVEPNFYRPHGVRPIRLLYPVFPRLVPVNSGSCSGGLRPLVELCVEPAGLCGRCTGVAVPLRRGAWWSTVHGVAELDMTERLN